MITYQLAIAGLCLVLLALGIGLGIYATRVRNVAWKQMLSVLVVLLVVPATILGVLLMANGFFGFLGGLRGSASARGVVDSTSMGIVLLVVGAVIEILAWVGIMVMRRKARLEDHRR
jgi:ABC-type dipeptide/oligopeptide/nickel transport system permease component